MKAAYRLQEGKVVPSTEERACILAYAAPEDGEKQEVTEIFGFDPYDLESAVDPDEVSRVEFDGNRVSLIWKRPKNVTFGEQFRFEVDSLGLFLHRDRLIVIGGGEPVPFASREFHGAATVVDTLLRLLLHTVHHYLGHLKVIKQITVELGGKVTDSMENRYFLQMFALGESLIYYHNAIEANAAALVKLRANADRLTLSSDQVETLDNLILDNQQCARQAQIHSSVLSGLMDARGTIISNNVNVLLKNLTLINVIFLPLTLIASIGGMSEYSAMTRGVAPVLAYGVFAVAMILLGILTWFVLSWILNRRGIVETRRGGRRSTGHGILQRRLRLRRKRPVHEATQAGPPPVAEQWSKPLAVRSEET